MAFYIKLNKVDETSEDAIYEYFDIDSDKGRLKIIKLSGEITEVSPVTSDDSGRLFQRAAIKIFGHWKADEFPETTEWAS